VLSPLGDGAFHPMDRSEIEAAVRAIRGVERLPDARIWVLPFPRRRVLVSSCHESTIFLSPGIRPVPAEHVHATVVHEIGHVVQHAISAPGASGWETYLRLRDLDEDRYHSGARHRDRPEEIFAEDFRYLMGGELATASGRIENPDLITPDLVPGLALWFRRGLQADGTEAPPGAARALSYPNPFRVGSKGPLSVRFRSVAGTDRRPALVFDLHGRLVRALEDPQADRDGVVFRWDGRDRSGRHVVSGAYFVTWPPAGPGAARVQVLH
jgi:hypothetical protein